VADTPVLVNRNGPIATLTINRPDRRNGVDIATCHTLSNLVRDVAASNATVLIVRGAGNDFCVGADLLGSAEGTVARGLDQLGPLYHSATLLQSMPQVTIAAIDGGCAGAGLGWACACDFRFASEEAKFSTAFLNVVFLATWD
jgi:2-(1,2-epoxy-1,2-dihydrophenyl)acetyl-CoA isomerase